MHGIVPDGYLRRGEVLETVTNAARTSPELGNVVERRLIMGEGDTIEAEDVRQVVRLDGGRALAPTSAPATSSTEDAPPAAATQTPNGVRPATLREFKEWSERAFLVEKLREFGWNISKTAEVMDTPRSNLYKKLEQYNIRQDTDG